MVRHDPAPVPGRVIAVNAPLEDGQWGGDLDDIVTNGIQWLSDNVRNLPWLEPVCRVTPPPPVPRSATAIDYTCPPIGSGDDWNLTLFLDGSTLTATLGTTLQGKVFIEHNVSDQDRVNIPVRGTLREAVDLTSVSISGEITGTPGVYTFTTSTQPISATMPITYLWDDGAIGGTAIRDLSAGEHTLMVTATNVSSLVTATHTISITAAEVCTPLMSVDLNAMGTMQTGSLVTFTADLMPDDANKPYSYTIDYDDGSTPITGTASGDPMTLTHVYAMTGTYTVEVGVWNCDMMTPLTTTHTVTITTAEACTPLESVDLSAMGAMQTGSPVTFTADLMPDDASKPYSYTIDYDDGSMPITGTDSTDPLALTHTYNATGTYSVEIGVWNCDMTTPITATYLVTITTPGACVPLADVDLNVMAGTMQTDTPVRFRADLMPDDATKPYSYTIDYGDGTAPLTAMSSADPLTLTHTYNTSATYTIEIGVWNCDITTPITDMLDVEIVRAADFYIYLPLVLRGKD